MNASLKRELFWLSGLASLAALTVGKRGAARAASLASIGFLLSSMKRGQYSLRGRTLYITGSSRGLGLSLAWNALARGAGAVTLVARNEEELESAREILLKSFPDARIELSACDVTDRDQLAASIDTATEAMGGIDILVNNAGAMIVGPMQSLERAEFEAQMELHLYSVVDAVKLIFPYFKSRGGGRILNICSLGGKVAVPHMLPYDASKFALSGFAQGAAAELKPHNVVMTTAYPTVMRTGSPKQAVFKGDHEKEFLWFAGLDNLPGLSLSADAAAKKILDATEEGRSEVVLSAVGQLRILLGAVFPETMNAVMGVAARLLPRGESSERKTGAASDRIFERNIIFRPLRDKARAAEGEYNQTSSSDADHNLGLKH